MLALLVIGIIWGILIYVVGLSYCMNNRKIIYARNKKTLMHLLHIFL